MVLLTLTPRAQLFMALDVDIHEDDIDWLGRPTKLPNIMAGEGIEGDASNRGSESAHTQLTRPSLPC